MSNIRYSSSSASMRGTTPGSVPNITITETPIGGASTTAQQTVADLVVDTTNLNFTINNFKINVASGTPDFISTTPGVCSVDSLGNVARITDGICNITAFAPPIARNIQRNMQVSATLTYSTIKGYTAGSLAGHIDASIRAMVSGNTAGITSQAVLSASTGTAVSPNFTRNASIFTGSLDLSAITVYTTAFSSNLFPVVLISPQHIIAGHVGCSPGQQIVFKRLDGNYEVRTVVSQVQLSETAGTDFIGILNSPITTITPMKLLPSTWATKLPAISQTTYPIKLPVLNKGWAAGDKIRILECTGTKSSYSPPFLNLSVSTDVTLSAWSSPIIGGDSNGPVFVPINGNAILLHCMNYTTGGAFYPGEIPTIQAAMNTLGGAQTLGTVDLTGFNTY